MSDVVPYLQGNNVRAGLLDLFEDGGLAVLPGECPGGTVAVHLPCGVLVTQHVVGHDRESNCVHRRSEREKGEEGRKSVKATER